MVSGVLSRVARIPRPGRGRSSQQPEPTYDDPPPRRSRLRRPRPRPRGQARHEPRWARRARAARSRDQPGRRPPLPHRRASAAATRWELQGQVVRVRRSMCADLRSRAARATASPTRLGTWSTRWARLRCSAGPSSGSTPSRTMSWPGPSSGNGWVGRLGLSDAAGWPLCAAVRPPRIDWSA